MWKQLGRAACLTTVALAVLYFGGGALVYERLSRVTLNNPENISNTPDHFSVPYPEWRAFNTSAYLMPSYQTVRIPSRQPGITLSAWYVERDPAAPVVVLTHGLGSGKFAASVLVPAGMLFRQGFNVLVYDLRNHGESSRDNGRTAIGNKEYLDLLGAWDWLVREKSYAPARIGVYGLSLGGAAALIAFGEERRMAAVFVDSAFSALPCILQEELVRNNYPAFLWRPALVVARVFYGEDLLAHSPLEAVRRANDRPIFLVHGSADQRVRVEHARRIGEAARQAGARVAVWIPEGMKHVAAMFALPGEYERRMAAFFRDALAY